METSEILQQNRRVCLKFNTYQNASFDKTEAFVIGFGWREFCFLFRFIFLNFNSFDFLIITKSTF